VFPKSIAHLGIGDKVVGKARSPSRPEPRIQREKTLDQAASQTEGKVIGREEAVRVVDAKIVTVEWNTAVEVVLHVQESGAHAEGQRFDGAKGDPPLQAPVGEVAGVLELDRCADLLNAIAPLLKEANDIGGQQLPDLLVETDLVLPHPRGRQTSARLDPERGPTGGHGSRGR